MFLEPKLFVHSAESLARDYSEAEALDYTRWLATHHYENFHVVSFLLPKHLHQDFYNVYAFCRWADDLGDEMDSPEESLQWLGWWRDELEAMYAGRTKHPVFVALDGTVRKHKLPIDPFADLIHAFVQDQTVTRYHSYDELFRYCRYSANPVGRLVLYLCGYSDQARQLLSDAVCTALQLTNFWQDITVDLGKKRIYLPLEAMARHGYTVNDLTQRRFNPQFQAVMSEAVWYTRDLFAAGATLAGMVDRRLALDIELFRRGGLCVLDQIEAQGYNVLERRPAVSKTARAWLLLRTLASLAFSKAA